MRGLLKWKGGLVVVGALSVAVAAGADEPAKQQMPVSVPAASAVSATTAPAGDCGSATNLTVYWKDGLRMDTCDKNFRFKFGGRVLWDATVWDANNEIETAIGDDLRNGTEFRSARLYFAGEIYKNIVFKAEYDFANDTGANFKDVYIGVQDLLVDGSAILVGSTKVPFSIEEVTSNRFITFMERGLPNAFAPGYETGLHVSAPFLEDRLFAGFAISQAPDNDQLTHTGNDFTVTARLAGLPYMVADDQLVHLGVSYSYAMLEDDQAEYQQRPEVHFTSNWVDTGAFDANSANTVGVEAATVWGPFSAQGEYMRNFLDSGATNDPSLWGYYAFVSYFVTGEHRDYKVGAAKFDRVAVKRNFLAEGSGTGAWELALRYSHINLNDELADGGILSDVTAGVNWYLNPNTRVMFNYVYADLEDVDKTNAFMMRTQIDF